MKRILSITAIILLMMVVLASCFLFKEEHVHTPSEVVVENEVLPTCTENGSYDEVTYCTDPECNAELSRVSQLSYAKGHTVDSKKAKIENEVKPTCTEAGSYDEVIYCLDPSCGDEVSRKTKTTSAKGHSYEEEIVSVHVPESEGGEIRYVCSECDDTYYEYDNHDYSYRTEVVEPTCYRQGYTVHTCVCGGYYIDEYVDELPHNVTKFSDLEVYNGSWIKEVVRDNGCLCDRVLHYYPVCQNSDCGAHLNNSYGAFTDTYPDHRYDDWKQVENTDYTSPCEQETVWIQECVNCHCYDCAKIKTEAAPGHVWSLWSMVTAPTADEAGEYARYCTVCAQPINGGVVVAETVEIPHLNKYDYTYRVIVAPTAETTGKATYTLKNNPAIVVIVELPVDTSGHDAVPSEDQWVAVEASDGTYYTYYCTHCEKWLTVDFVAADAAPHVHRFSEWFISVKPTADTVGEAIRICEDCAQAKRGYRTIIETIELPVINADNYKIVNLSETCDRDGMNIFTYYYTKELTIELTVKVPARGHVITERNDEALENGTWYTYFDTDQYSKYTCHCIHDLVYVPVCQDCGASLDRAEYRYVEPATGHNYDPDGWQEMDRPSKNPIISPCIWAETWVNECTNCHHFDHAEMDVRGEAPGHVWSEWTVTVTPGLYSRGEAIRHCLICEMPEFGGKMVYDNTLILPWLNKEDYTYAEQIAPTIDSEGHATYTYDEDPSIVIEYIIPKVHTHDTAPHISGCVRKQNGGYYYYIYKCNQCNEWVLAAIRPVHEDVHSDYYVWGEWNIVTVPSKYYGEGKATRYCFCDECTAEGAIPMSDTIILPVLNSSKYVFEVVYAGCTYAGGELYHYTHKDGTVATVIFRTEALGHEIVPFSPETVANGQWILVPDAEHNCACEVIDYYYPICQTCFEELDTEEFRHVIAAIEHEYDPNGWIQDENPGSPCEWADLWINNCIHCGHYDCAQQEVRNPAPGHTWGAWSVAVIPTEVDNGMAIRYCTVCSLPEYGGMMVTDVKHLSPLTSDEYTTVEISPDCLNPGTRTYTYTCDDDTIIEFTIDLDALGHATTDFSLDEVERGSWIMLPYGADECPCEIDLHYYPVCQECGVELNTADYIHTESVRGHSYDPEGWQKAEYDPDESPCSREDIWVNECLYCNHYDCADTEIRNPAPGHTYGEWAIVTAPTTESEGEAIRTCIYCSLPEYGSTILVDRLILPALNSVDYNYTLDIKPDYENTGKATYTYKADESLAFEVIVPTLLHDAPPAKENCMKQESGGKIFYIYFCHECGKYVTANEYTEDAV